MCFCVLERVDVCVCVHYVCVRVVVCMCACLLFVAACVCLLGFCLTYLSVHAYMRSYPMDSLGVIKSKNTTAYINPKGVVHVMVGTGGFPV